MWKSSFELLPWISGQVWNISFAIKNDIPADQAQQLQEELLACAAQSAQLDNRMQEIRKQLVSRADKGNQS